MKVYVSLHMYEGLPTDLAVFATREGAEKDFSAWMAENRQRDLCLEIVRKKDRENLPYGRETEIEDLVPSDLAGSGIYEADVADEDETLEESALLGIF